jgi:integrase
LKYIRIEAGGLMSGPVHRFWDFLFVGLRRKSRTGFDQKLFGTHSLRRTKATLICRRTGNLRAVQLLLGHTKIESTARYLGIEVDDALAIAEQVDV